MKTLLFFIFNLIIVEQSYAFTLNPNTGRGFKSDSITIRIADTDCSGAGFSTSKLRSLTKSAVDYYWNNVATSNLKLKVGGIDPTIDIDGMTHATALDSVVPNYEIVAGCNDDANDFNNPAILGSAAMKCTGNICKAILILNANNSNLNNFSSDELEAVIAHEIGHAFGLGHSESKHNLMYYSVGGKSQKWLGLDDIDGVSYLYPHDAEGLGLFGNCGTIQNIDNKDPFSFLKSFLFGILFMLSLSVMYRKFTYIKLN